MILEKFWSGKSWKVVRLGNGLVFKPYRFMCHNSGGPIGKVALKATMGEIIGDILDSQGNLIGSLGITLMCKNGGLSIEQAWSCILHKNSVHEVAEKLGWKIMRMKGGSCQTGPYEVYWDAEGKLLKVQ